MPAVSPRGSTPGHPDPPPSGLPRRRPRSWSSARAAAGPGWDRLSDRPSRSRTGSSGSTSRPPTWRSASSWPRLPMPRQSPPGSPRRPCVTSRRRWPRRPGGPRRSRSARCCGRGSGSASDSSRWSPTSSERAGGLGGYLDSLPATPSRTPRSPEFIDRGRGIVERMGALVGDLLELSRVEAGTFASRSSTSRSRRLRAGDGAARAHRGRARIPSSPTCRRACDRPGGPAPLRADHHQPAGNPCKFAPLGGLVEVVAHVEGRGPGRRARRRAGIETADRERVSALRPLDGHERTRARASAFRSAGARPVMGGEVAIASVPGSGSAFVVACRPPSRCRVRRWRRRSGRPSIARRCPRGARHPRRHAAGAGRPGSPPTRAGAGPPAGSPRPDAA